MAHYDYKTSFVESLLCVMGQASEFYIHLKANIPPVVYLPIDGA